VKAIKLFIMTISVMFLSACGDDKTASNEAAPAAESAMAKPAMEEASMAMDDEYGRTIDHTQDAAEFELRRSIAGHDRMIEQYTADGYATDELEAHKAELSASLDALMGG
jgi:hypothetical protein